MATEDKPLPNEGMIQFLRRKRDFYQLVLCAWDHIEFNIDQLVARQFGLNPDYHDKKVGFLFNRSFEHKLDFLKKMGVIVGDDFHQIKRFQNRRNELVHSEGWGTAFVMTPDEKDQLMDEAVEAAEASFHVLWR